MSAEVGIELAPTTVDVDLVPTVTEVGLSATEVEVDLTTYVVEVDLTTTVVGIDYGSVAGSGTAAAEVQTATAAVTLSGHRAVTPQADGSLIYADNATLAHRARPTWVTTAAAGAGSVTTAVSHGTVSEPSWSWAPGQVYLGANGVLTQTPPTKPAALFLVVVGMAVDPTTLFVHRQPSITLS